MEHYVLIQWPDSQQVIETALEEGWSPECILASTENDYSKPVIGNSAYFVPVKRIEAMQTITRETIMKHLFDYQLGIVGKTRVDTMEVEKWRFDWTLTRKQYQEFKKYAIALTRKVFKCNRIKAEDSFAYFFQTFGLRIKN